MGGQQSTSRNSKDGADCSNPCFFLDISKMTKKVSNRSTDAIGSPEPETPIIERRKRKEAANKMAEGRLQPEQRREGPFSSRYGGLEKEIPEGDESAESNDNGMANVHEGPNAEKELHEKYQLMEVLGVGSTSTVHRCLSKRTDMFCACKIIDKFQMEDRFAGMMDQFHTEIDALRQLRHDSIIQLYDVYLTDGKIYIVMEMMEGGELFDYVVQKGTLNEEEASQIVRRVTSALVYMHSKNIVHRDLKPENLLLRRKPKPNEDVEVKIIDFGLSKALEDEVARSFLGTRGYLAPEMLQRREYTKAVDTWALGVIVFVLLCGCLPFDDDSQTVPSDELVRSKYVLRFPRWASNLSASAKDLLAHLLDTNPKTRYSADQALHHPWVRGQTAPRNNLLASPGRIKKSPLLRTPRSVQQKTAKSGANGRRRQQNQPYASPDSHDGTPPIHKRKQSI